MPALNELYRGYNDRVAFYVVYIQEAHPTDAWQLSSNIKDNVLVATTRTDAERLALEIVELQAAKRCRAQALDVPCRQDRGLRVVLPNNRKVEDRHQAVAHRLVDNAVMRPDGLSAAILEQADDLAQSHPLDLLPKMGEAADVGKQDGRARRHMALLLDVAEGTLADRTDVRVHLAAGNAEGAKRQRQRPANGSMKTYS